MSSNKITTIECQSTTMRTVIEENKNKKNSTKTCGKFTKKKQFNKKKRKKGESDPIKIQAKQDKNHFQSQKTKTRIRKKKWK